MNTEKLEAIAELSAKQLKMLIAENEEGINEAIIHATEEAQIKSAETNQPQKVKIAITHKINLDLGANKQTDVISWTVAHKSEIEAEIPNHDQLDMDIIK